MDCLFQAVVILPAAAVPEGCARIRRGMHFNVSEDRLNTIYWLYTVSQKVHTFKLRNFVKC